jgi:hypothetical protein
MTAMIPGLRTYSVSATKRRPLIDFMLQGLTDAGCKILHVSDPSKAPFIITFETATSERMGVVAYAFLAKRTPTRNRPKDERSFQLKYGNKADYHDANIHDLWQDPMGMFTTLLVGIDPAEGYCVSADPLIHSPTKFFIRLEFKDDHATEILSRGWFPWERVKRAAPTHSHQIETLVGARRERFLDLIRFERAVRGADPGDRYEIAARHMSALPTSQVPRLEDASLLREAEAHPLALQFDLRPDEILDLISGARRLKMAVRGWVAEEHLRSRLARMPDVVAERLDIEGAPDLRVSWRGGPPLLIECKNVGRTLDKGGRPRIDFQRTRAAKGDPCSRYYQASDFDIVAACLHGVTDAWEFRYVLPAELPAHKICEGRLSNNVRVDDLWTAAPEEIFRLAYAAKSMTT